MKLKFLASLVLVMALLALFTPVVPVQANGAEVCPDGDGWVKVDNLSGFDYTYTPPAGYHVSDNCYKHSTYVHYGSGPTVSADLHWNDNAGKFIRHELSHAAFKIEPNEQPTNTPTPTEVPHVYTFEIEQFNHCDRWERSIRLLDNGEGASEFIVLAGNSWPNNGGGSVSGQSYSGEIDGHPYEVTFEAMSADECGNPEEPTNTPTPTNTTPPDQPTNTPTPTATATHEKPADPAGGCYLKKSTFGPASAFANIPNLRTIDGAPFDYSYAKYGGPEAMVEVWGVASFDLTSEDGLAIWMPSIGYADGYDGIASYGPETFSLGKKYGLVESDWQGQFVIREGTQAGNKPGLVCEITVTDWSRTYIGWIVNILPQDATPLPPPAEQPTPAPIPDTGAAGAAGFVGFGLVLLIVAGVIGLLVLSPKRQ